MPKDEIEEISTKEEFLSQTSELVKRVSLRQLDMGDAKMQIARNWKALSERRRAKYAQEIFADLHRMSDVTSSIVGEFEIISIHDRV